MRYLDSIKKSEYELPKALQKYGLSLEKIEKRKELENKRYLNNNSQQNSAPGVDDYGMRRKDNNNKTSSRSAFEL